MTTATTSPAPASDSVPATRWTLDPAHTNVLFTVRHMMISNVRGEFGKVTGEVAFDPSRPEQARLTATIDVASINTREEKRDAHLRSPDFLDVEKYPTIAFASKAVRRHGDGYEVTGDLTIHGTTREIALTVEDVTAEHKDPWGNTRVGASARTKIKRSDFGMQWNAALELGGVLVGDEVSIHIDAELIKAQ